MGHYATDDSVTAREDERLLRPREVADLFRVDTRTVTRWAEAGQIEAVRTPGGTRRYRASEAWALLCRTT